MSGERSKHSLASSAEVMVEGTSPSTMIEAQALARQLLVLGFSQAETARQCGVSATSIRRWRRRYGGTQVYWTREKILLKFHEWNKVYGRPPTSTEWLERCEFENGHRRWPGTANVQKRFGSWNKGMRAAGFTPHRNHEPLKREPIPRKYWQKEEIVTLMQSWASEHRLPPSQNEWNALPEYPSSATVAEHFGSWNGAIEASGFRPRERGLTVAAIRRMLPLPRKENVT